MNKLTHFDKNGNAVMVDVSQKNETERIATACSSISLSKETLECIKNNQIGKGDVLGVIKYYNDDGEILGASKIVSREDLSNISLKTRMKILFAD